MASTILGLDIGGANLKAATNTGRAASVPFALWKQPAQLAHALDELITPFADADELAVTMTGELCDCFETKRDGVRHIVSAVMNVSRSRPVRVWSTDGVFLNTNEAKEHYLKVAAANWHALATFVGGYTPRGVTLLIDIGSTTTDLIPILDGLPWSEGKTDTARMRLGELVYTGVRRTPATTFLGTTAAAEFFATVHDAHLLLGSVPEDAADTDTADGRPATRLHAHGRLSRMVGGDPVLTPEEDTQRLARSIVEQQRKLLHDRVAALIPRLREMRQAARHPRRYAVVSGSGEFLARQLLRDQPFVAFFDDMLSLTERLGPERSAAAPAYAVATLAAERPL
ncbi:hydantoinase/oxoprolinase family protein [Limnoglobus roseus]|uniref:H4MPT-linked C1 transfer pathway protein n=1 Tax=Limnoglobus roseus TaxID=2598579 RepID=A0A5C1AB56_9BACT|nr:hydantoinase/oxoprolinase family protein [Limnoglobus roseus]QEL16609.1 H4MPT-linked C1 transfer pathway protein [Limnoglobus roseus]